MVLAFAGQTIKHPHLPIVVLGNIPERFRLCVQRSNDQFVAIIFSKRHDPTPEAMPKFWRLEVEIILSHWFLVYSLKQWTCSCRTVSALLATINVCEKAHGKCIAASKGKMVHTAPLEVKTDATLVPTKL